jgi:hypothetical protein
MPTITAQKWEVTKGLFGLVGSQQILIAALWTICECHQAILREICEKLGLDLPPLPQPLDPAALQRLNAGLIELERMFRDDEDPPDGPEKANA